MPLETLTTADVTVFSALILFAHGLPIEQKIIQKVGPRILFTSALRLLGGLVYAFILHRIFTATGWLQEPVKPTWIPLTETTSWGGFMFGLFEAMFWMGIILVSLFWMLAFLKQTGILEVLMKAITPVLSVGRLHADETTVPLLARGGTKTARLWTYVRDDRPFNGDVPPAALFHFSRDREMTHPNKHLTNWQGILQSDAYAGYNDLYRSDRDPGPVASALCWSHARRKFFELADIAGNVRKGKPAHDISPIALEAVQKIDTIFDIERDINGLSAEDRHAARQTLSRPLVEALHAWFIEQRARMSKHNPVAKAIKYMIEKQGRWDAFTTFLDDGRICLTNNAAERALRGVALGRKSWLFAGSERGGDRAAFMYTLIVTAKMNDIDPQAWLADVLKRLPDMPVSRVHELLPWNWKTAAENVKAA